MHPDTKLTEIQVRLIKKLYNKKISMRKIAKMFNVSHVTIYNIIHNKKWKNIN